MKKWLLLATALLLIGSLIFAGAMTALGWDFAMLSTAKFTTNRHALSDSYTDIVIYSKTADIVIAPSSGNETTVICHEYANTQHSVSVTDGTLVIRLNDTRKWYEHIGFNFEAEKITVNVPQKAYNSLSVKISTGDLRMESICADRLHLSASTGDLKLRDVDCKTLIAEVDTGDISLKNVLAEQAFVLETDTGDILFDRCDAATIEAETDTGDVTGTLLSEKVFITDTDTGSINVPKTITGGKCEITTDTGDIKIKIP